MPVADASSTVRVRVPAKVNLHLAVGTARADGYHELCTVFQAVSVFDEVAARPGKGLGLVVDDPSVPDGPQNLAWQAALLLAEHAGVAPDVRLSLAKTIPVAGGMAGGSADAAATLVACAALWHTGTAKTELAELAADLGSDVAFPLHGGTALGTGRGEQLTPILATGTFHWAFALADYGISAGEAYRELDRLRAAGAAPAPAGSPDGLLDALRSGNPSRVADMLCNDLEAAALSLRPGLRDVLAAGMDAGALTGLVSGSGPTCAFLCPDGEQALRVAAALDRSGLCAATRTATGPVPGARVLV